MHSPLIRMCLSSIIRGSSEQINNYDICTQSRALIRGRREAKASDNGEQRGVQELHHIVWFIWWSLWCSQVCLLTFLLTVYNNTLQGNVTYRQILYYNYYITALYIIYLWLFCNCFSPCCPSAFFFFFFFFTHSVMYDHYCSGINVQ